MVRQWLFKNNFDFVCLHSHVVNDNELTFIIGGPNNQHRNDTSSDNGARYRIEHYAWFLISVILIGAYGSNRENCQGRAIQIPFSNESFQKSTVFGIVIKCRRSYARFLHWNFTRIILPNSNDNHHLSYTFLLESCILRDSYSTVDYSSGTHIITIRD